MKNAKLEPIDINIIIGKFCGKKIPSYTVTEEYKDHPHWNSGYWQTTMIFKNGVEIKSFDRISEINHNHVERFYAYDKFPDYYGDLNAIHEAEKHLSSEQCKLYTKLLKKSKDTKYPAGLELWHLRSDQRAEAFIKIIFVKV